MLGVAAVLMSGRSTNADDSNAILDLLEKKGIITHEEAEQTRQEYQAQQQQQMASVVAASATNTPAPFVFPGGKEIKLTLGGYFQGNAEFGDVDAYRGQWSDASNSKNMDNRQFDRFKIRRARVGVWGDFLENFDFKLMGDFGQGDGTSPRDNFSGTDIYINWHQFPELNVKFGQYDTPFGMEQFDIPDMMTLTPERSQVTEALRPERQIGAMVWGKPFTTVWPEEKDLLTYYFGVFNGNLRNINVNDNNEFMYMGRMESTPYQGKLFDQPTTWKLGADVYTSADGTNTLVTQTGNDFEQSDGTLKSLSVQTHSDRRLAYGGDEMFTCGPFTLDAEYLQTHFHDAIANIQDFTSSGYWVVAGYQFVPKRWELVGKWESFTPGQKPSDDFRTVTGGINWYVRGHGPGEITIMLDYLHTWSHFRELNPGLGADQFDEIMARAEFSF